MKWYFLLILAIPSLTISLIGCSYYDTQPTSQQEESTLEFDEQAVFQKVDNLQVGSFIRQQDLNDTLSALKDTRVGVDTGAVQELENQLEFLRLQYQQLQEIKYELVPEALDNLITDSLLEQQRMKTGIEIREAKIIDGQKALEEETDNIQGYISLPNNLKMWNRQIKVMTEQLEFLTKQYQQLEELGDFIIK